MQIHIIAGPEHCNEVEVNRFFLKCIRDVHLSHFRIFLRIEFQKM